MNKKPQQGSNIWSGGVSDRPSDRVESDRPDGQSSSSTTQIPGLDSLTPVTTPHAATGSRAPVGRQRLNLIAGELGTRDRELLASLVQHRFLTTSHIERWHFTGHSSALATERACRRTLTRLRTLGLIDTLARRLGGVRAGSTSYIWYLTPPGHRLLGGEGVRVREPSTAYLAHELGLADTHVALIEAARESKLDLIDATTEPTCWRTFVGIGAQPITLKPDMWAVTGSGDYEDVWFVEYDRGTESLPTIVKKASVYETYRATGIEQRRSGVFPRVLWVAPDQTRADKIARALGKTARITSELHLTTTAEHLITTITNSDTAGGAS